MKVRIGVITVMLFVCALLFAGQVKEDNLGKDRIEEVGLPALELTIDGIEEDVTLYEWMPATISLTTKSGQYISGDYVGSGSIKGRGNLSWLNEKKPYSIRLNEKDSLLDMPASKKYAVISLCFDASMLRNYITYKAGSILTGIDYIPKCEFIDFYFNGEYKGIYLLTERVDVEPNKVQLHEATQYNIAGGYLLEKDVDAKINKEEDIWFDAPYQANPHGDLFTVRSPEVVSDEMLVYLESYMQKLHDVIMDVSDETYTQYVDVDSWIDFLIIQELTKNIDGNLKTSCYMTKHANSDLMSMATIWDFDFAYGMATWGNEAECNDSWDCPNAMTTDGFMVINSSCPWYLALYARPEFCKQVKERYAQLREVLVPELYRLIDEQHEMLCALLLERNYTQKEIEDHKMAVIQLKQWIQGRVEWLDAQWLE